MSRHVTARIYCRAILEEVPLISTYALFAAISAQAAAPRLDAALHIAGMRIITSMPSGYAAIILDISHDARKRARAALPRFLRYAC